MQDLQDIVDDLAEQLGRPVTIDDRHGRLLVHSAHGADTDEMRQRSILSRRVSDELVAWTRARGVDRTAGPTHVPGDPELGFAGRFFVPLRSQGLMLGYLSVIDSNATIGERESAIYADAAATAASVLYRQRLLHDAEWAHEQTLVRDVLFREPEAREQAAKQLVDENLIGHGPVAAIVVQWAPRPDLTAFHADLTIRRALVRARRSLAPASVVELTRIDRAVLLVLPSRLGSGGVRGFARSTTELIEQASDGVLTDIVAGFGGDVSTVERSRTSYDQAMRALRVAERLEQLPQPVGWCDLGINRVLSLLSHHDAVAEIFPGCRELARNRELRHTIERYLELAGDVQATARELSLHRSSLYARLEKAERITGLSLKSGEDRLALQLSLRLLLLTGAEDEDAPGGASPDA